MPEDTFSPLHPHSSDTLREGPNWGRLLQGLDLVALGLVLWLARREDLWEERLLETWPLFLAVFGLGRLLDPTRRGGLFPFLLGLGLFAVSWADLEWQLVGPMMLVIWGVALVIDRDRKVVCHD